MLKIAFVLLRIGNNGDIFYAESNIYIARSKIKKTKF